jgi:hypothetical protein
VVAIPSDKGPKISFVPLGKNKVKIIVCLLLFPTIEDFVHDYKAHAVRHIEKLWCRWIMRHADSVHSEFSQSLQLAFSCTIVPRAPESSKVMAVLVYALDS